MNYSGNKKRCGPCWWFKKKSNVPDWQVPSGSCINLDKIRNSNGDQSAVGLYRYASSFACAFYLTASETARITVE